MSSATITTSARLMNSTPQTEEQAMVRKVAVSSFLGNFIEWFDYASYSYFATTIALVFFPTDNHTVAMLQTFGVFALSFILRPIGALFWGSYGDKKGRKAALAHSIMFMSGASFLIGCLPSYSVIGVGARRICAHFKARHLLLADSGFHRYRSARRFYSGHADDRQHEL